MHIGNCGAENQQVVFEKFLFISPYPLYSAWHNFSEALQTTTADALPEFRMKRSESEREIYGHLPNGLEHYLLISEIYTNDLRNF